MQVGFPKVSFKLNSKGKRMGTNFWLQIAVQEALVVAQGVVAVSTLTAVQKTALEAFITAGQNVAAVF
jgi:hypothetical protein